MPLISLKQTVFIICFIYSSEKPEKPVLIDCAHNLMEHFKELSSFFLSMGPVVLGFKRASFFLLKQQESF